MFIIIGTRLFTWGSQLTPRFYTCGKCGAFTQFVEKTGMRFLSLFFFIPLIPISGKIQLLQCPQCKTRFDREG